MPEPIQEIADSRAAATLLAAHPEWSTELVSPGAFSRAEMARELAGAASDDELALKRRLRHLRSRVLLRVMARDHLDAHSGRLAHRRIAAQRAAHRRLRDPGERGDVERGGLHISPRRAACLELGFHFNGIQHAARWGKRP